jgi:DNA repair exonuclease SbcCD nuclease subunit
MEAIALGDLHTTDASGKGGIAKYVPNYDEIVFEEADRALEWARERGIRTVFLLGDTCESPRMSYEAMLNLVSFFARNEDMMFYVILGNHDMFSDDPSVGHSLQVVMSMYGRPNVRFIEKPETIKIDKVPVRFLPYPHEDFDPKALNVFHKEVYGSKGDSGRPMKDDKLSKSKAVVVAGHLHTSHRVRNTFYPGTLAQKNFGEKTDKYFAHIDFKSATDFEIEFIPFEPKYLLHTVIINDRRDLKQIPKGQFNLVKLVIADGADVSGADWTGKPNIVEIKNFKSQEELKAVLTEDMSDGEALSVDVEEFFTTWLDQSTYPDELKARVQEVRARVRSRVKVNTEVSIE